MYTVDYHPLPKDLLKSASSTDEVSQIMRRIYEENPSYWPYGLSVAHHDGGVYMVREASTRDPVGFVGWQERTRGMRKVGYYSIGILPEHRGKHLAREAVSKLLQEKAAGVDEVRALILHTNTASRRLAESLDIPVELLY